MLNDGSSFLKDTTDYIFCKNGERHVMKHQPEFRIYTDSEGKEHGHWIDPICCEKCNQLLGFMGVNGCKCDINRKHNIERVKYMIDKTEFESIHCLTCGTKMSAPVSDKPLEMQ